VQHALTPKTPKKKTSKPQARTSPFGFTDLSAAAGLDPNGGPRKDISKKSKGGRSAGTRSIIYCFLLILLALLLSPKKGSPSHNRARRTPLL